MLGNNKQIVQSICAIVIFALAFWGIHYTSDWAAYRHYFDNPGESRDFFFGLLSEYFKGKNYSFEMLYRVYISLIALSYVYLFNKIKSNPIVLVLTLLIFNYVAMGNQIRFFLAFPCCLLAFYEFLEKKYILTVIFLTISILNHKTAILLFSALIGFNFFAYKLKPNKQIIIIILSNIAIYILLNYISSFDEKYNAYNTVNRLSSFLGGIFNVFPYLFPIYFIYRINKKIKKGIMTGNSVVYRFLYVCSIAPTAFLFSGIYIQVLTNRFIIAFLPIWLGYFLYVNKNIKTQNQTSKTLIFTLMLISVWNFIVKPLLGFNEYFIETALMLDSYSL